MKNHCLIYLSLLCLPFYSFAQFSVEEIGVQCDNLPYTQKTVLAVAEFEVSASRTSYKVGTGMVDMLTNALVETGCFRIVERKRMKDLTNEQALGQSGMVNANSAAQVGQMTGAQMMVMANITEFKEKESGGIAGGLLRNSPIKLGAVGKTTAHLGMIIRIANVSTGEILLSKSIDKKVSKVGAFGGGGLPGLVAGGVFFKSKAMQDAVEEAIIQTVEIIAQQKDQLPPPPSATNQSQKMVSKADCQLFTKGAAPSIMVLIAERNYRRSFSGPASETEIIRQLLEFGFDVVDPQQIEAIREQERVNSALNDPHQAAALGRDFGADIIIIGEAYSEQIRGNNSMVSQRGNIEARAIQTNNGKIIAANGSQAAGVDVSRSVAGNKALKNAGANLSTYFLQQLCEKGLSGGSSQSVQAIEVVLLNASFMQVSRLEKFLKSANGTQSVKKSFAGKSGRFQLMSQKNADDLAEELATNFNAFKLEITGLESNKLTLAIN